jgi:outer membrane protein assembly factor BamB
MDQHDTDLAAGTPMILPDLDPATTSTPHLIAFGGKQGNAYLVDRAHLAGRLDQRPPCSSDSTTDKSLLPPEKQPQFGARGPLNVFGPYSENANDRDQAKARSTPAYFRGADGTHYVFFSGSTKVKVGSSDVKPPSLARLRVVTTPGQPAYFAIDATDTSMKCLTPGSPVVTSNGSDNAIVWVLDANVLRTHPLVGPNVPHPILYAIDATTLKVLWSSTPSQLQVGGKYSHPTIARGVVFVGTDRIQAFGLQSPPPATTVNKTIQ